jgi:hypothetical protein
MTNVIEGFGCTTFRDMHEDSWVLSCRIVCVCGGGGGCPTLPLPVPSPEKVEGAHMLFDK